MFFKVLCVFLVAIPSPSAFALSLAEITYVTEEFPPYTYVRDGVPMGLGYDVLDAALKAVGVEKDMREVAVYPWARALNIAKTTPNVCIFTINRTASREPHFKWVGPIAYFDSVFITKGLASIQSGADIERYSLGVQRDASTHHKLVADGYSLKKVELSSSCRNLLKKLEYGRVEAVLLNKNVAYFMMKEQGLDSEQFEMDYVFESVPGYIAFSKDTPDAIVKEFERGVEIIRANGKLELLLRKYLPKGQGQRQSSQL